MNNRRIPHRPASREAYKPQPKQEESALDFFKDTWNKREQFTNQTGNCEDYLKSLSIKNQYGIQTSNTHRVSNINSDFKSIINDEDTKEIKLVGENSTVKLDPTFSNRVEYFYAPGGKKVSYSEITKVEAITPGYDLQQLKNIGYSEFYQLYKYDIEFKRENKLCVMAIYKG